MLTGKNAIVTGANRGIGRAIVEAFASNGANIWACARKSNEEFEQDMKRLEEQYHVWIHPVYFEMSDEEQIKQGFNEILNEKESIDILVNNAGVFMMNLFQMSSMENIREVYQINVFGPMQLTQLVLRKMMRQKSGNIINMASLAAYQAASGNSVYGSSKAALAHWTEILASEVTGMGIRVNAVAPGITDTDLLTAHKEDTRKELADVSFMGRLGKPEEIAEVAVFLASDKSSFVNGQIIQVNGGVR